MKIAGTYEVKAKGKVVFTQKSNDCLMDWFTQKQRLLNRTNTNEKLVEAFKKFGLKEFEMSLVEEKEKPQKAEVKKGRKKR